MEENYRRIFTFYRNHKTFLIVLVLALSIRIFTFFVVFLNDSILWVEASTLLVNGINPYGTDIDFFYKYPPLFYYILTFFGFLTDFSYLGPKLMIFSFEIMNIILIYKIGIKIKDKTLGTNAIIFYAFNPVIVLQFYHDVNEFVTLFFTLLSIYYLICEKFNKSSISLSLGIAFKIYPIFFLIPISIFIFRNKKEKKIVNLLKYYALILITVIILSLPFLIDSPSQFIEKFLIHGSRMNLGDSVTERIPELLIFFNPAIDIFGIQFSYQFLIQLIVMGVIFVIFFVLKKEFNIHDLFTVIVIITLILPLINYQIQLKYTNLMSFPFLLFIIYKNMKKVKEFDIYFLYIINIMGIITFFIVYLYFFPPASNLVDAQTTVEKGVIMVQLWLIESIIFIINDARHKKLGDYKVYFLNMIPFIVYNLIFGYIGAIITLGLIFSNILYIFYNYWYKYRNTDKIFYFKLNN